MLVWLNTKETHSSCSTVTHHTRSIVTNFRSNTSPLRWSFRGNKNTRSWWWKISPKNPHNSLWPTVQWSVCSCISQPSVFLLLLQVYGQQSGEKHSTIVGLTISRVSQLRMIAVEKATFVLVSLRLLSCYFDEHLLCTKTSANCKFLEEIKHRHRRNVTSHHSLSHVSLLYFNFFNFHH